MTSHSTAVRETNTFTDTHEHVIGGHLVIPIFVE